MIKVQFSVNGENKVEVWDMDGWTINEAKANIEDWVKEHYPTATDIKIIEVLIPLKRH